jgi:methyl-accepting chemotaxis protein
VNGSRSLRESLWHSLRWKLTILVFLPMILVALGAMVAVSSYQVKRIKEDTAKRLHAIVGALEQDFRRIDLLGDQSYRSDLAARLQGFPELQYLMVLDQGDRRLFYYKQDDLPVLPPPLRKGPLQEFGPDDEYLEVQELLGRQGQGARVYLRIDATQVRDQIRQDRRVLAVVAGFLLAFTLLGLLVFRQLFSRPLERLVQGVERITAERTFDLDVTPFGRDEIGRLAESFAALLEVTRSHVADLDWRETERASLLARIRRTSEQLDRAAQELAAAARQMEAGADHQAGASEDTDRVVGEIAAKVDVIAEAAGELARKMEDSSSATEEMASSIEAVSGASQRLASAAGATADTIARIAAAIQSLERRAAEMDDVSRQAAEVVSANGDQLSGMIDQIGKASKDIGKIVGIIEEITDQTGLLSVNASIEAANAGEAGRGFAVVAYEVKRLADRAAGSTREIQEVVDRVQRDASAATQLTREILGQILGSVSRTSELVGEVYRATQSQNEGARQALATVEEMRQLGDDQATALAEQTTTVRGVLASTAMSLAKTLQVAEATDEQRQGAREVVRGLRKITDIADDHRTTVKEVAERARELAVVSRDLTAVAQGSERKEGASGKNPP